MLQKGQEEANRLIPYRVLGKFLTLPSLGISLLSCLDSLAGSRDHCAVVERKHRKLWRGFWMMVTAVAFWFWLGTLNPVPPPAPGLDQPQPGQTR